MNFNGRGRAESLRHFTTVTSTVYPDLFDHYDAEHQQWCEECSRVEDEED
jgi:hypothetical protein